MIFVLSISFLGKTAYGDEWTITIKNQDNLSAFVPTQLPIKSGDTVRWTNDDLVVHRIVSGVPDHPDFAGTFFSIPELNPGESSSKKFYLEGFAGYYYYCQIHPWLTGKIFFEDYEHIPNSTLEFISFVNSDNMMELNGVVDSDFANTEYEIIVFDSDHQIIYGKKGTFTTDAEIQEVIELDKNNWKSDGSYYAKLIYGIPSESYTIELDVSPIIENNSCDSDFDIFSFKSWYEKPLCLYWYGLTYTQGMM